MSLTAAEILEIHQLLALHGHLVDDGELHRLDELFTTDASYDVTAMGQGVLRGVEEFRAASQAFRDDLRNPIGHHVTNIVVSAGADGAATARSKGIGVLRDGRTGTVTYHDHLMRTADGWRILARRVLPGRATP